MPSAPGDPPIGDRVTATPRLDRSQGLHRRAVHYQITATAVHHETAVRADVGLFGVSMTRGANRRLRQ